MNFFSFLFTLLGIETKGLATWLAGCLSVSYIPPLVFETVFLYSSDWSRTPNLPVTAP